MAKQTNKSTNKAEEVEVNICNIDDKDLILLKSSVIAPLPRGWLGSFYLPVKGVKPQENPELDR